MEYRRINKYLGRYLSFGQEIDFLTSKHHCFGDFVEATNSETAGFCPLEVLYNGLPMCVFYLTVGFNGFLWGRAVNLISYVV